jgi:hypothetical protein
MSAGVLMERAGEFVREAYGPARRWRFGLVVDRLPGPAQRAALARAGVDPDVALDPGTAAVRICFEWAAPTLAEAVVSAVRLVEALGLRALRVDAGDWVTLADIAERIGRSRETVRLWAVGRLGPGGFPPPVNLGRDTSFYSWAEVLPWLRHRLGFALADEEPTLAGANLALQLRALAPRIAGMDLLRELLDP